jgi:CHAT domain-containing protein
MSPLGTLAAAWCAMLLQPGAHVERRLVPGQTHTYAVSLEAGDLVRVNVEQRGIDVVVDVRDPAGTTIDAVQQEFRPDHEERVEIAAAAAGTYTLQIKAADAVIAPGGYVIHLSDRRRATAADNVAQRARSTRLAAVRLETAGRFSEARPLFERALTLGEDVSGPDDPFVATVVFELAGNALEARDDARARPLYERAIGAFDRLWGSDHPYTAMARSRLAVVLQHAGERAKAEAMVRQSLAALESSLGAEHPWVVRSLATLANLRVDAGDVQEGEAIDRRALASLRKTGQSGTILEATVLNNLAEVLRLRHDASAESLFVKSLEIGERLRGPESYFVSTALLNLGIMARERKDYAAARAYYTRALAIREPIVGPNHPDEAPLLNNLANVYHATGDAAGAIELYFRALRIWERAGGPSGRGTLVAVGNIARTYASLGDIDNAVAFQQRADAILETQLELNLAAGSERQKLAFARSVAERTDRTISLHLIQAPDNAAAAALAAQVVLQRKGRVQDAMTDVFTSLRGRVADDEARVLMDRLKEATARLARVSLDRGDPAAALSADASVIDLERCREAIEAALSDRSAEFRGQMQRITLDAVQSAIPEDAALIEFATFRSFNPAAEGNSEAYAAPHYAAYVLRRHGPATGVDLGPAADLDRLVALFRGALRDPARTDVRARARALDERVMRPLRASLGDAARLLISPDGDLNLVPFEALSDERGRYLIERYAVSYLTSGRDLLRVKAPRGAPGAPVIVADPRFGDPAQIARARPRSGTQARPPDRSVTPGADTPDLYFAPLKGTAAEGRAIKALFPAATLLTGSRATKASLEEVKRPLILHIASHGFFLPDASRGNLPQNPLLHSGLALAGANVARGTSLLTALEASGLDLWGTELVTLSACDTGVGEIRNGEGVYGFRRAFVLAGAETLVMSLWPVRDAIARDTMVGYYERLRSGAGRGDALRQAKLAILERPATRHPYFWAAFIQSGESAPLTAR